MNVSSRVLTAIIGAAAAVTIAGCSASAPIGGSSAPFLPVATSSTLPPFPPPPPPTGSVGGIDVALSTPGVALLRPGGDPLALTVRLTNTTPADIPDVRLVVSFGHCSCGHPAHGTMPNGTMRMLDPATNAWVAAPYVVQGTGTDYLTGYLVPPFVLKQGETITYQLEARMDANPDVTAGTSLLFATIFTPGDKGNAASLPITVEPQV